MYDVHIFVFVRKYYNRFDTTTLKLCFINEEAISVFASGAIIRPSMSNWNFQILSWILLQLFIKKYVLISLGSSQKFSISVTEKYIKVSNRIKPLEWSPNISIRSLQLNRRSRRSSSQARLHGLICNARRFNITRWAKNVHSHAPYYPPGV